MSYPETLQYLFQQLPMYQRVGQAAYKADLQSTHALMDALGHPQKEFKSIHVGGTNGKGSTSHLLASILQEAGYKVGLYTSPHLVDFRERIRLNGKMIGEDDVVEFVEEHRSSFEPLQLSFFEWSVGLAFHFFRKEEVDIAVIEVGMGGRLDSTNVITPKLSIITNIGWDHAQFLGDSLELIATEKAGIIKQEIPVIIGKSQRETEGVFRKTALRLDAPITFADQEFPREAPPCALKGNYQEENIQSVMIAVEHLLNKEWTISEEAVARGLEKVVEHTGLRGRWEVLETRPLIICDVAHNREGLALVFEQVNSTPKEDLHLVMGFVNDKNVQELLGMIPSSAKLYLCAPSIPRAMPIDRLHQLADELRIEQSFHSSVEEAFEHALGNAKDDDLIFVGGSTFVVADLLTYRKQKGQH